MELGKALAAGSPGSTVAKLLERLSRNQAELETLAAKLEELP